MEDRRKETIKIVYREMLKIHHDARKALELTATTEDISEEEVRNIVGS